MRNYTVETARLCAMNVHEIAAAGFQKGSEYNDARPSYTDEAVTYIKQQIDAVGTEVDAAVKYDVLELGAGTGLFTRKILSILPKSWCYLATDPSEGFLKTLREKGPDVETHQCTADCIPLPDNSVKVIICAQAFHWFSNRDALEEMRRVMVDRGKLIFIWNQKDYRVPWMGDVLGYILSLDETRPIYTKFGEMAWRKVFEGYTGFTDEQSVKLPGVDYKGDKDLLVKHFSSISVMAALTGERRQRVLKDIRDILQRHPETRDNDIIQLPLFTDIYVFSCCKH